MKILVVEPHCDDAFLSLGWHLQHIWKEHERVILTVFSDKKRDEEATAYAEAIGATSISLCLQETPMEGSLVKRLIPEVRLKLAEIEFDQVYFPLGLQHPDHINTAFSRLAGAFRYLDTPYQAKQKLSEELIQKSKGMEIQSICFPPKNKWKHIPLFKSQSKFFHFNQDLKESKLPEIVLCLNH